jgi:hypothetical protein
MAWEISVLKELFSYWKFHKICPHFYGPGARQCGPPAHGLHKTGAIQIAMEGSDPPGKGVSLFSNLSHYGEDGQKRSNRLLGAAALGHRHGGCHCNAARAGRSSIPSLPDVWRLELFGLKWCGDIGDTHPSPGFNHGEGWLQGCWRRWLNLPGIRQHCTALLEILQPQGWVPKLPRSLLKILPWSNCFRRRWIGACDDCFEF